MDNWIIENAGLFDFSISEFSAALQIDWNYHSFQQLTIRNNYWNGIDIIYNDLTKKPAIRNSRFENNRRHGFKIRSPGMTIEDVIVSGNGNAGFRYNPRVSVSLQRDIITWLERREQPEMEANNVYVIPNRNITTLSVHESQLNQRKFLLARPTTDCPLALLDPCVYELSLKASGFEYGLSARIAVQIVNRIGGQRSDEDIFITDPNENKQWSVRKDAIQFPIVSSSSDLRLRYTRTYGNPEVVLLILFLDAQEYLDRFVHVYRSVINENQYGLSSVHYSLFNFADGTILNRWSDEKLWFQKVNFTANTEAVVWVHSPQAIVIDGTPIAQIGYHIDNCSIVNNTGSVIETHRDLYSSANVFRWNLWSNTFADNKNTFMTVHLPDTHNLISPITHSFLMTENRFENNKNFGVRLDGFYAFANISSNNFTKNIARQGGGIVEVRGMEKHLIFERNRILDNWGLWALKMDIQSQTLRSIPPPLIQYNYFLQNRFISSTGDYVDSWPRSFAVGIFGAQLADVHFNRFRNVLFDFELVSGCKSADVNDKMNVTYNWWGVGNEAQISQRIFDLDDWNIYTLAEFSPFFVTDEQFINFWWTPQKGQLATGSHNEPSIYDLRGRMYESKTLTLNREKWHEFPFYYKPNRPYRIIKDLTIMPNATLTIEKGVEVHIWPNVRILVLGHLIAEGTFWEPIRFKPINMTEYDEIRGQIPTRYRRFSVMKLLGQHWTKWTRFQRTLRAKRRAEWIGKDIVYKQFPSLHRQDPFYQRFTVRLNGTNSRFGFLEMYNATTGEYIPSCDREFTFRNAQVVCRELGFSTLNVYHWLTPRWEYNPLLRILKTYVEPRECIGNEPSLDQCRLRMNNNISMWQCMDSEHFNFIYCGPTNILNSEYLGNWGGIAFSHGSLEYQQNFDKEKSILRYVEVVGGGLSHNDTKDVGALLFVHRFPTLQSVNITNSSMDALQVIFPQDKVVLSRVNITHNRGRGLTIWVANVQGTGANIASTYGAITIPYNVRGMLDICSARKQFSVKNRIFVYYKYDSYPVDCVKYFVAPGKNLAFRFLLINLYNGSNVDIGRADSLTIYTDNTFTEILHRFTTFTKDFSISIQSNTQLAIHFRASAADGDHGFVAEIVVLPSVPQINQVEEVFLHQSRIEANDRGAICYRNTGEMGPNVIIDDSSISHNGYHLYGNISTSSQAVELHLHNTMWTQLRSTLITHNIGGLLITSETSSAVARLVVVIRDSALTHNCNSTTLALLGNTYQKASLLNNLISQNYALYQDTVIVRGISTNFTHNLFFNNTGLHTIDIQALAPLSTESHTFYNNWFHNNIALGHGHQYLEDYGFQPGSLDDEFSRRPKRQVLDQKGVSFDWWTHIGTDTQRYRSTVFAGVSRQIYRRNAFDNPLNPYELTTAPITNFDTGVIDARENYWGYPGTVGVASGKIRDGADYDYLIRVEYQPVLESNTSLIEGDCSAGWFAAGFDEFKSCFLYVGAAATYSSAVKFCEEMDAFVPFLRADDARQKQLAQKVETIAKSHTVDGDRFSSYPENYEQQFWISSVSIPATQCGWMSSRSANIGTQNCNNLLPFVCERGTKPYEDPPLWRAGIIIAAAILGTLFALLVFLALCWCRKSRKRAEEEMNRKEFIRASLRLNKMEKQRRDNELWSRTQLSAQDSSCSEREDAITLAHKSMIHGENHAWSPTETLQTSCSKLSLVTATNGPNCAIRTTTTTTYSTTICPNSPCCSDDATTCSSSSCFTSVSASTPLRNRVSNLPNPYADATVSTFNSPQRAQQQIRLRENTPRRTTDLSSCSTGSTIECSTCPTDSENYSESSTLTEGSEWNDSSSARSSTVSEKTIVARPLIPHGSSQPVLHEESRRVRPASTSYADYFKVPHRPAPPPPIASTPTETVFPVNSQPALNKPPLEMSRATPTSASYRARLRPGVPPPVPPQGQFVPNAQPASRSLVDLASPHMQLTPRRNSTGRYVAPIETSM
ncbi:hypothetical protein Tcan_11223 [Toxocara canis]|uniref:SRCR domain-containing protein n=1 Tax=Toxocara canis TaxID=6265 RepID=A0A0B2V782_TOXCA|nr:hypothetical protein Tcan_11223 [Toxocara canis]